MGTSEKSLQQLRADIDAIDGELLPLLLRRLKLSGDIAAAKRAEGRPVFDPAREREILTSLSQAAGPELARSVRSVYSAVFDASKSLQRQSIAGSSPLVDELDRAVRAARALPPLADVACSGSEGSYAQQAASRMFEVPTLHYFNGFEQVFEAVEDGACQFGVLPIENSTAGSVVQVYDLMRRHRFHIVRGLRLKVEHVLLGVPGADISGIKEAVSHPQALAQCAEFLKRHPQMRAVPAANTATAAKELAASGRTDRAVIASRVCAGLYGLAVLADGIADSAFNYTRFICIAQNLAVSPRANKFSLMLGLPHRPGSLSRVTAKFADVNVNLTKLESRPVLGSDFEFLFIFEFGLTAGYSDIRTLLSELSTDPEIEHFAFLGMYEET